MTERPIRVMVVDDHAVVRGGLSAFLLAYDDLVLVGEAANGVEAVRLVALPPRRDPHGSRDARDGRGNGHPSHP